MFTPGPSSSSVAPRFMLSLRGLSVLSNVRSAPLMLPSLVQTMRPEALTHLPMLKASQIEAV